MKKHTPDLIKKNLFDSIDLLLSERSKYLYDPERDFTRTQKISFHDSMLFPMIVSSDSTAVEMLDYFPIHNLPSQAALSYRRGQIKVAAFMDLFKSFTSKLPQDRTFRGMRLIACDGTRLNTPYNPKDTDSFVNCIKRRKGFNQYHLNTCYDVLNDIYLDAVIQNYFSMNENQAFCEMMDRFPQDIPALFTADRGYDSYNVIAHAIKDHHRFVIRLTSSKARYIFDSISDYDSSDSFDIEDDIHIGRVRNKESRCLRNYHFIRKCYNYDFIAPGICSFDRLRVRLVKFKLPGGDFEYLLTNLPCRDFPISDIKEIYRLRWGIETSFRFLKYASEMNSIHSLKQDFIFQEIYAKLTSYNFCAAIMKCLHSNDSGKTKYKYGPEKTYLIKICMRYLKGKLDDIFSLISKRKVPVRADRSFSRSIRRQHADTLQYR